MARTTRLEQIFIVPKVLEPLKFDCNYVTILVVRTWLNVPFADPSFMPLLIFRGLDKMIPVRPRPENESLISIYTGKHNVRLNSRK